MCRTPCFCCYLGGAAHWGLIPVRATSICRGAAALAEFCRGGILIAGLQKSSLSPLLNLPPQVRQLVVNQVHRRNNAADRPHPEILNANPDGAVF